MYHAAIIFAGAMLASLFALGQQDEVSAKIIAKVHELRQVLAGDVPQAFASTAENCGEQLATLGAVFERGNVYAGLQSFAGVAVPSLAISLMAAEPEATADEDPAARIAAMKRLISSRQKSLDQMLQAPRPAAVQAIIEVLANKARVYPDAGGAFFKVGAGSGLYYLNSGLARIDLALFLGVLGFEQVGKRPDLPKLGIQVNRLEQEILTAYADPESAIENHATFIQLNAGIKEMRELGERGYGLGSTLQYLALRGLMAQLSFPESHDREALQRQTGAHKIRLGEMAEVDHSLGRLFLQQAGEALAQETPQGDAEAARALASLEAYWAMIEGGNR